METNPRHFNFILAAASALTLVSAPARAEGVAGTKLGPHLESAVRKRERSGETFQQTWEIDEAVIAAADSAATPEGRDQLVPVLVTARARHAAGYDRLRDALCTTDEAMSADRARACSTLPAELEDEWRRSHRTEQWVAGSIATAAYAGAITAAFVERDQDAGRGIATAAGVPMGAATGMMVLSMAAIPIVGRPSPDGRLSPLGAILVAGALVGGGIAGGVVGAQVAHSLAASPGARAPLTAVALAPVYFTTLVMTIDW